VAPSGLLAFDKNAPKQLRCLVQIFVNGDDLKFRKQSASAKKDAWLKAKRLFVFRQIDINLLV